MSKRIFARGSVKRSEKIRRRFAYILTIPFVSVIGAWAHDASFEEVVLRSEGTIISSSRPVVFQNPGGGILSEILVHEGDIVEAGDVLVRIESAVAQDCPERLELDDACSRFQTLLATEARLVAELEEKDEIVFPKTVMRKAPAEMEMQRDLFELRKQELQARTSELETMVQQRAQDITKERRNKLSQLEGQLKHFHNELSFTKPLPQRNLIENQITEREAEVHALRASIIRELRQFYAEGIRDIETMKLAAQTEVSNELNKVRAERKSLERSLFADQDRMANASVPSPVRGTVKNMKVTVGGIVRPGDKIMAIVPLDPAPLLVETRVRPADIAYLRPGQKAVIKIPAYDFSTYGGLNAKLKSYSRDKEGERAFYRVYLLTEENSLHHNGETLPITPGTTVTAEILTGEKSILDHILQPIIKAKDGCGNAGPDLSVSLSAPQP